MSTTTEKKQILDSRWRNYLTSNQRDAWSIYAKSRPKLDKNFQNQTVTGKQMYVLCNLPNVE